MRINSKIWLKVAFPLIGKETGFDADGNPVSSEPSYDGEGLLSTEASLYAITEDGLLVEISSAPPLDAYTEVISENRRAAYADGKYKDAKYRILIEIPKLTEQLSPTQIKLIRNGEELGEFAVISCIHLPTVGRIEIIV